MIQYSLIRLTSWLYGSAVPLVQEVEMEVAIWQFCSELGVALSSIGTGNALGSRQVLATYRVFICCGLYRNNQVAANIHWVHRDTSRWLQGV
jgi:hypothetical protein